jgi:NTP pyrophosphatase (non-canonical NTP hydrolase)
VSTENTNVANCNEDVYPALALRTLCPDGNVILSRVDAQLFRKILIDFIRASKALDVLKKVTVYGKEMPGMSSSDGFIPTGAIDPQIYHAILGIATEGGELVEAMSKTLIDGVPLDVTNVKEELGDLEWFEALLRDRAKLSPGEVRATNIAKLEARYKKKQFDAEAALKRDHDAERKALQ